MDWLVLSRIVLDIRPFFFIYISGRADIRFYLPDILLEDFYPEGQYEEWVGWGKNMINDYLLRKNARGLKKGKRGNFHCILGKKYHF